MNGRNVAFKRLHFLLLHIVGRKICQKLKINQLVNDYNYKMDFYNLLYKHKTNYRQLSYQLFKNKNIPFNVPSVISRFHFTFPRKNV